MPSLDNSTGAGAPKSKAAELAASDTTEAAAPPKSAKVSLSTPLLARNFALAATATAPSTDPDPAAAATAAAAAAAWPSTHLLQVIVALDCTYTVPLSDAVVRRMTAFFLPLPVGDGLGQGARARPWQPADVRREPARPAHLLATQTHVQCTYRRVGVPLAPVIWASDVLLDGRARGLLFVLRLHGCARTKEPAT